MTLKWQATYHYALMSGVLPRLVDLTRVPPYGEEFTGRLALAALPRISPLLADRGGVAEIRLGVDREAGGRIRVQCEIRAQLALTCQRCLGIVQMSVTAKPELVWVRNEAEAESLVGSCEPLWSETGKVDFAALVEDELLLALPVAPVHEHEAECAVPPLCAAAVKPEQEANRSPFAALAALKRPR